MTEAWDRGRGQPPIFNAPRPVVALIAVLAAIHLVLYLLGEDWQIWALYAFSFIPKRLSADAGDMISGSQAWSFLTYGFLHADWMHLLFNSLWLLVFGTPVARYLGGLRFFLLCAIATIAGAVASLILHWQQFVIMVGASGAVSGLLAAAIPIMYGWRVPGGVRPLSFTELLRSTRALTFMAVWLAITLYSGAWGWTGTGFMEQGAIAWEAHVGGFLAGLAGFYLLAWRQVQRG